MLRSMTIAILFSPFPKASPGRSALRHPASLDRQISMEYSHCVEETSTLEITHVATGTILAEFFLSTNMNRHTHIALRIVSRRLRIHGTLPTWIYSWIREKYGKISGAFVRHSFTFLKSLTLY